MSLHRESECRSVCVGKVRPVMIRVMVLVVDVNNLKNGSKPVKLQKENPVGCAGEDKQSKGN